MTRSLSSLEQLMFSLVEVWKSSGQKQRVFCQEKDLAYSKFQYWLKRYREYHSQGASEPFIAVSVRKEAVASQQSVAMELVFPDGRRLVFNQGVEAGFLRTLLS